MKMLHRLICRRSKVAKHITMDPQTFDSTSYFVKIKHEQVVIMPPLPRAFGCGLQQQASSHCSHCAVKEAYFVQCQRTSHVRCVHMLEIIACCNNCPLAMSQLCCVSEIHLEFLQQVEVLLSLITGVAGT